MRIRVNLYEFFARKIGYVTNGLYCMYCFLLHDKQEEEKSFLYSTLNQRNTLEITNGAKSGDERLEANNEIHVEERKDATRCS